MLFSLFKGNRDPYFSNIRLLLHGNGANGGTVFTDSGPAKRTATRNGAIVTSTAQSKFNGSSILFDGINDYLSYGSVSAFSHGSSAFTWECFIRFTATASGGVIFATDASGTAGCFVLRVRTNGKLTFDFGSTGPDGTQFDSTTTFSLATWYHIAITRSGNTFRMFINGTLETTQTASITHSATAAIQAGFNGFNYLDAYLAELRITHDVARYTASFTAPTAPYPND